MNDNEKKYNQMQQEFLSAYRKDCQIHLTKLENKRKVFVIIFRILFTLSALGVITSILFSIYKTGSAEPIIFSLVVLTLLLLVPVVIFKNILGEQVKKIVMPKLCNAIKNIEWLPNAEIDHCLYKRAGIVAKDYKEVEIDDTFTGSYNGVNYQIAEATLKDVYYKRVDGKSEREVVIIFRGVLIAFDMNKNFDSHTLITPQGLFHISGTKGLKHTELEDVIFEKYYDVYTNHEIEARYLITPAFMERFNNIKMSFKADSIRCAFYENKLLIGLETSGEMFEPYSIWEPLTDEKQYFQMFEEVLSIIKLIDHFKLNEKTGV